MCSKIAFVKKGLCNNNIVIRDGVDDYDEIEKTNEIPRRLYL